MAKKVEHKDQSAISETVSVVIQALILAVIIRSLFIQPFNIPSGSMKPTLLVGDYIFVSKWSYGYSRHSLPFSPPIFNGRIWGSDPERGDVVVFKFPPDPSKDYIKRLIGLPGDKIQLKESTIFVNGQPIDRIQGGEFTGLYNDRPVKLPTFREKMPNGRTYSTLDFAPGSRMDTTQVFEVPAGNYFFMGDNRDNSDDSRQSVGMVPAENLVGKAQVIFLSLENKTPAWQFWRWPMDMRWGRLFSGL